MDTNVKHILPIQGFSIGIHEFDFKIDQKFFLQFQDSLVKGDFDVHILLDKQASLMDFEIAFKGVELTTCDRCLTAIELPVEGMSRLVVQFDENERIEGEVIFIHPGTPTFDIAPYILETITVAVPIIKKCLDTVPCDAKIEKYLTSEPIEEPDDKQDIWSELKKLKN